MMKIRRLFTMTKSNWVLLVAALFYTVLTIVGCNLSDDWMLKKFAEPLPYDHIASPLVVLNGYSPDLLRSMPNARGISSSRRVGVATSLVIDPESQSKVSEGVITNKLIWQRNSFYDSRQNIDWYSVQGESALVGFERSTGSIEKRYSTGEDKPWHVLLSQEEGSKAIIFYGNRRELGFPIREIDLNTGELSTEVLYRAEALVQPFLI